MIGYFPTPHPDELLYSVCARFQERSPYTHKWPVTQELFGSRTSTAIIDLPTNLGHLAASLPYGHSLTVDRLIRERTLLPFYNLFLPHERIERIKALMRDSSTSRASAISQLCGIKNSSIRSPGRLRFCPLCVEDDRKRFKETYWHRLHQVTGVEVCPVHAVFLEDSEARRRNREDHREFILAEQAIKLKPARFLNQSDFCHTVLLNVARDSFWLLNHGELRADLESMRSKYVYLLSQKELALVTGLVRIRELLIKFKDYYSSKMLERLQCDFNELSAASWLARIIKDFSHFYAHHPLRHLLLIRFLGHSVETFFRLSIDYKPFGDAPWSCLNPACRRYLKSKTYNCQVVHRFIRGRKTIPVGTFSCPCGFVYTRIGPDVNKEDQTRIGKVISYGSVWEAKLRKLWNDPTLGLSTVARELGVVNRELVKREAIRLGLYFPRRGPGHQVTEKPKPSPEHVHSKVVFREQLSLYRRKWKAVLRDNPKVLRSVIRYKDSSVYYWLNKYDKEWLRTHMPPPKCRRGRFYCRVNWHDRDVTLAQAVRDSAERLKCRPGRPIRLTMHRIDKDINYLTTIKHYLNKLPRTRKAFMKVVETRVQFAKRRLQWAADRFREENILPTWSALVLKACFGSDLLGEPEVKDAVESILQSLKLEMSQQHYKGHQRLKVA